MRKTLPLLLITLFYFTTGIAQTTLFKGTIMGFESKNAILSKNKHKNLKFQGGLKGVVITYTIHDVTKTVKSDASGDFNLYLPTIGNHRISMRKSGYSTVVIDVFQEGKPLNYQYDGMFVLLKKTADPSVFMGTIKINADGKLEYRKGSVEINKSSVEYQAYNFDLGAKTVDLNNANGIKRIQKQTVTNSIVDNVKTNNVFKEKVVEIFDTVKKTDSNAIPRKATLLANFNLANISNWKLSIDSAKQALSRLDTSSIEYKYLLNQIELAEEKIKDNETIIRLRNEQLSSANKTIMYISLFVVLLILLAFLLLFFLKQRKAFVQQLKDKNKTISTVNANLLSSIRFASLIQKSYLQSPEDLRSLYKNSFLYNRPKDIVSGDFYWFGQVNETKIIIVADCTGHGVPGAMLTVLGHSTIETIVQDKSITKPSEVIAALNKTIVNTFGENDEYIIHGMDLTVITSKENSNEFVLSGASNGLYTHGKGGVKYHEVSPYSLGQEMDVNSLTDTTLKLEKNDTLFLFSDGYIDQFKEGKKIEKFNVKRFEKLLTEIATKKDISNAEKKLETTLNEWKKERSQIDDILIVGIKL